MEHLPTPDIFTFPKQPIHKPSAYSLGLTSAPTSSAGGTDSEAGFSDEPTSPDGRNQPPVSLLTALLNSDRAKSPRPSLPNAITNGGQATSHNGLSSARSSVPSTAFSSPTGHNQGILQNNPALSALPPLPSLPSNRDIPHDSSAKEYSFDQPTSILRRGSVSASSDGGDISGLGVGLGMTAAANKWELSKVEEKREKIEWADEVPPASAPSVSRAPSTSRPSALKFTVAQPVSTQSSDSSEPIRRHSSIKHVTEPTPRRESPVKRQSSPSKRPASPFARERQVQAQLDEQAEEDAQEEDEDQDDSSGSEEAVLPGYKKSPRMNASEERLNVTESEESDAGYQEDEEDGAFSDEDEISGIFRVAPSAQFPFARPTNYRRRRKAGGQQEAVVAKSVSPPPAPAVLPPPSRRGRGHIRVMEDPSVSVHEEKKKDKGCSRHCSPPPSRPRTESTSAKPPPAASSPSARKLSLRRNHHTEGYAPRGKDRSISPRPNPLSTVSDAGPRNGRMGSPMPPHLDIPSSEDDTDAEADGDDQMDADDAVDEEDNENAIRPSMPSASTPRASARSGWRSDDSIFYGPNSQQARNILPMRLDSTTRNASAPPSQRPSTAGVVFYSDEEHVPESVPMEHTTSQSVDGVVRDFIRRASEHLPQFMKPVHAQNGFSDGEMFASRSVSTSSQGRQQVPTLPTSPRDPRDAAPLSAPLLSQATCPPALDNTPATAFSYSSKEYDLTSRLEQTLHQHPANLTRARSVINTPPGRVTFHASEIKPSGSRTVSTSQTPLSAEQSAKRPVDKSDVSDSQAQSKENRTKSTGPSAPAIIKPIACPKSNVKAEDHGWTDEALRRIRRNAGKDGFAEAVKQ